MEPSREGLSQPHPKIPAIKRFLNRHFADPDAGRKLYGDGLDVSPLTTSHRAQEKIATGEYEITNFAVNPPRPGDKSKSNYRFYVSDTEFFVNGKAAEEVDRIEQELLEEPQKPK